VIRRAATLVGVMLVLGSLLAPPSTAEDAPQPYELTGTGAWTVANQMNSWAQALFPSRRGMNLAYLAKGSRAGRGAFARGEADFAIAGRPFTAEDLAALEARRATVIAAPISVGSAALLLSAPYPGLEVFTPDPLDPEEGPGTRVPYASPLRFPMRTVAQIFLDKVFNNWLDPEFLAANAAWLPAGSVFVSRGNLKYPEPVVRSDGSATNHFLQQVIEKYAPAEFSTKLTESGLTGFEVTESWPFLYTGQRSGGANAGLVGSWLSSKGSDSVGGGVITPTPISEARQQIAEHPTTQLFIAELENAAGEYVAPNTASISLAIERGDGAALAAMNAPIPGGYPLAWVNSLYAPGSGLGIEATNALVTFVRYAVTVGQEASVQLDEGRLSPKLVAEALAAGDAILSGNCSGGDRKLIAAADGGPFWPSGVTLPPEWAGRFTICAPASDPAPAVTRPTAATASVSVAGASSSTPAPRSSASASSSGSRVGTVAGSGDSYPAPSSSGPLAGSPSELPVFDGATGLVAVESAPVGGTDDVAAALTSATLPMGLPDDGRGSLDRLATMLLGGLVVISARGFFRRMQGER